MGTFDSIKIKAFSHPKVMFSSAVFMIFFYVKICIPLEFVKSRVGIQLDFFLNGSLTVDRWLLVNPFSLWLDMPQFLDTAFPYVFEFTSLLSFLPWIWQLFAIDNRDNAKLSQLRSFIIHFKICVKSSSLIPFTFQELLIHSCTFTFPGKY